MTKVFNYFDDDHSGFLDSKKVKKMASECFFNLDEEMIDKMIQVGDTDGNGKVSKYEFLRVMKKIKLLWLTSTLFAEINFASSFKERVSIIIFTVK